MLFKRLNFQILILVFLCGTAAAAQTPEPGVVDAKDVLIPYLQGKLIVNRIDRLSDPAYLVILTQPESAVLKINGKTWKPGKLMKIPKRRPAIVLVAVSAPGYRGVRGWIRLEPRVVTKVLIRLEELHGALTVMTTPQGANVAVDGRSEGTTPVTVKGLTEGNHEVTLTLGTWLWKGNVLIKKGKVQLLKIEIPPVVTPVNKPSSPQKSIVVQTPSPSAPHPPPAPKTPVERPKPPASPHPAKRIKGVKPNCKKICGHYVDVSGSSGVLREALLEGCQKRCSEGDLRFSVCAWKARNMTDVQRCANLPPP